MKISFGSFIPVRVYVDKKEVEEKNSQKQIEEVTNQLAQILSDSDKKNYIAEQQRRMFRALINDYNLPSKQRNKNIPEVMAETIGDKRYLVTGQDRKNFPDFVAKSKPVAIHYSSEERERRKIQIVADVQKNKFEKTLNILAISNLKKENTKDKYKIELIDFKA